MEEEKRKNGAGNLIVLFPFMAQGHLNPFLDLARHLASRTPSLTITIVSTPSNILTLRPRFLSFPTINFVDLPPFQNPKNAENTDALPSLFAISAFYQSSESLKPSFHRLISQLTQSNGGAPPICIISDMFLGFTVDVAHSFGSLHVPLYTSGPYAMSIYNSIWTHLPHRLTCADVLTLPDLPPNITIHGTQLSDNMIKAAASSNYSKDSPTFAARQAEYCRKSDGSLWNTVEVLEKWSLENWAKSSGKPVWAIGPLLPISSKEFERGGKTPGISPVKCAEWLNLHPPKSVVYVSFGSQNSIPLDQMMELAKGLEESEKGFIWVLRNPTGFDVGDEFRSEWLPEGFEERMREKVKGLLVRNWAPQMEILSHGSTGAFLSHCGWNSVLESLSRGVPMIGWPLGSEQFYNSKLLEEELGVCVEMARGVDAKIRAGDVAETVRLVLESEKGEEIRRRAEELEEEMKRAVVEVDGLKGSSVRALDDFVETLMMWGQ
ncbi:UDP-glucuronosyl/UDP-glucosyltransferase [Macleaya cordata]|uniref:Glycosyltransferase n=1 Tax=Macleaya cordata TaxID=56857 RepID=A0A200QPC3_MACCD|nr:UDP-glucuronosyl/UDP-glucosyltransferase [Macleaya cordata]